MKVRVFFLALVIVGFFGWSGKSLAVTYYADRTLSANCSGNYSIQNRNCSGSDGNAYRTISAAASATSPGDTVNIRSGTYSEAISPTVSGTANNRITFKAYNGETVNISGSPSINLSSRSYIAIDGVRITDSNWLEGQNAHHNIVQNSIFLRNSSSGTTGNIRFIQATYNKFLGNYVEGGSDNVLFIDSNRNLMEGNIVKEARHSIFGIRCGDYNIVRNNFFSNTLQKEGEVYDCGSDTSAVPNSFNSTTHNVIENNIFADNHASYYSISNDNGIQYSGQQGIIRNNVFFNTLIGLGMQVYGDEALYNEHNRVYHNVFYKNKGAGIGTGNGTSDNIFKNNILLKNEGCNPDCTPSVSAGQIIYRNSMDASMRFDTNIIFYQAAGNSVIESMGDSGSTIAQFNSSYPGRVINSIEADPQFVNVSSRSNTSFLNPVAGSYETSYDFTLQSGSPAINAGAFLTVTSSAGSGSSLPVADARYFTDGFGIEGETGDSVQLQNQTQTARITSVNYSTNTLTLDRSLSWSSGQGVALAYSGSAPDIGAHEYASGGGDTESPAAPQGLMVQ